MAGGFTAEGLDFCFALRQKGNIARPEACSNCRSHLTRFCGKRILCDRIFCTIRHCALRCFPPEAQCRATGSPRQFSLTTYTFSRGGGYAWPEVLRRRVWISALLCGRKETLRARKPVTIAAPVSHAFAGKGYCKHNGNRAVTAFLFPRRFCGKRWLCDRIFCTVWHCALRCFPPEVQYRAPKSSRQFSLTTYTFLRGGGYAWPEVLRRRVWISALLCGRKETLCARKPVTIAAPISHAFAGKGYCKHNGNRAVTAFLFPTRFCEKKRLCDRIFCTVWHCALRCFPPEVQCRATGSSRQFSLTTYTFLRGGGYAWPEVLRRRVWISALLCGRKETLRARKPVPIAAPVSHAFVGKGYCTHNGNRAVTAFLFPTRFCGKRWLCARIFALFGIMHCVAFRQKRNAMRPEVRGSSPYSPMRFFGKSDPQRSVHT